MTTNLDATSPSNVRQGQNEVSTLGEAPSFIQQTRRHGGTQNTAAETRVVIKRAPKIPVLGSRPVPANGPTLFVRMDRMGDLILSLPADGQFPELPDSGEREVDWWISEGLGFIADHAIPRRRVREMKAKISFREFKGLLREVKSRKYHMVIILHAPWWVSAMMWLAQIPNRVGPRAQWHSFLFLNKGVRQKRSLSETSEFEYNLRVMDTLTDLPTITREPLRLKLDPDWKAETLKSFQLQAGKYSVVHPGMGGSARNWPNSHYIAWIQEASSDETIVITGTLSDELILSPIKQALQGKRNVVWLDGKLSGSQLLHVLDGARCVLAPSTGVAHLAASLGRPTIGIYSPVKVQHPVRWSPQGESVQILLPEVECPGKKSCIGNSCPHFDCMNRISLEAVRSIWTTRA
jgi:heptosyltransferase I